MPLKHYDTIVIGAGQGGGPLAGKLAASGRRTAIVERKHVGGSCINEGCTPTKTMVASARVAYLARRAADYGVRINDVTVDQVVVRQRKRDIVESFRGGSRKGLERWEKLDLIMGEARFTGPKVVTVALADGGERVLEADTIVINTGARPRIPDLAGLTDVPYLDSTSIMELDAVPSHLIVLGGGFIGLEFGQMFRRFGAEVTVVERGSRLAPREDEDVCGALGEILRDDGIGLRTGARSQRVAADNGAVALTLETDDGEEILRGSHLLVAVGRVPNTEPLHLDVAGTETTDSGHIVVNERLQTSVGGVYAIGDVKGGPAFTHIAYDDYRVLRTNLIDGGDATITDRMVPYTVFIDPQFARVGLSEEQARQQGIEYAVAKMPMSHVARAIEVAETRGFIKVLVDPATEQILGCAVLGIEGGEMMSMIQIAMMGKLPYSALREATFAHPTLAEALNNLFGKVESASAHTQ
jgi:pyruvate/2-oxoglutarate dehydrogenase complex dihydrolipoamide dehydrogenase (E3) component